MKRFLPIFFLLCAIFCTLTGCDYFAHVRPQQKVEVRPKVQQVYTIPMPKQIVDIAAERGVEVKFSYGTQAQIVVHTNLADSTLVSIRQEGKLLTFSHEKSLHNLDGVHTCIEVVGPQQIYRFTARSGAYIKFVQPTFTTDSLSLNAYSGGEIKLPAAEVRRTLFINTSSAGEVICDSLSTLQVNIEATSGSSIRLYNSQILKNAQADASSGANILLEGIAPSIYYEASSGAFISAREMYAKQGYAEASSGANIDCSNEHHQEKVSSGGSVDNKER